jgi:hypothetical protein
MPTGLDRPFRGTIKGLNEVFRVFGGQGVIIGGVAVGLLTVPRATKDLDGLLVLDIDASGEFLRVASACGFEPLFSEVEEFVKQSRIAPLMYRPTGVRVDVAFGSMPFEEEILLRANEYVDADLTVRLPTPEDLIIMKAIAHRQQDLADILQVARFYPNLDRNRVKQWVLDYGELLETPELWSEIEPLLNPE